MRKATAIKLNIESLKHCFQSYTVLFAYPDCDRRLKHISLFKLLIYIT
nr:MAG TPA: hypothetical protein [Caudoviricetes sp.]